MTQFSFPLLAIGGSVLAYFQPDFLAPQKNLIVPLLCLIMFCMGLSLTWKDFARVLKFRSAVILGLCMQYSIMPLSAFAIATTFGFPSELLIGMVLVGAASGGTASNVICYLANANVALSISMTLVSTLLAVFMLPNLSWLLIGHQVEVPVLSMLTSVAKIVVVPVILGVVINSLFAQGVNRVSKWLPTLAMLAIVYVIAIIVALNANTLAELSAGLAMAVVLHNICGLLIAYCVSRGLKFDEKTSRTVAIEVGMQNSGLAVALAIKYFTPLSALPGALFSIWHNLSGSMLAYYWSRKDSLEHEQQGI